MVRKGKPLSKQDTERATKAEEEKGKGHETVRRSLIISEQQKQEMEKEIPAMRVITPSAVAQKYGVRVSIAKAVLAELEARGAIKRITTEGRFKLYAKEAA
jgi:small subunit ribosomal protein S25e